MFTEELADKDRGVVRGAPRGRRARTWDTSGSMKRCHASQTGCQEPALGLPSAAVLGTLSVPLANHVSAARRCSRSACRGPLVWA